MNESLCGKHSCPGICVRVCHCEAGLRRSRLLLSMQRNKREMSRTRPSAAAQTITDYSKSVGFISETRHHWGVLNQPEQGNQQHLPKHVINRINRQLIREQIRLQASTAILIGFLVFMAILVLLGATLNGTSVVGHYDFPVHNPGTHR